MKNIKYMFMVLTIFFCFSKNVFAGSLSVWASANTVTVGDTVSVSVNAKEVFGTFSINVSDSSILSGPSSGDVDNNTEVYTFTAKKAGSVVVNIVPKDMADYDSEAKYTQSKSVTIKVVNKSSGGGSGSSGGGSSNNNNNNNNTTTSDVKEKSSNNTLASLSVEGYNIDPKFDKDTLEYKLTVDEKVLSIKVSAKASDDKAEVKGTGEVKLSSGSNTVEVKVSAENGNEKIYKIIVNVEDQHPIKVKVDNKEFTVVKKNNDLINKLEGYEEGILKIADQDVVCYKNNITGIVLVILKDSNNKFGYYVYNDKNNTYYLYKSITVGGLTLQLLDYDKALDNFKKYKIKLQNLDVDIYKVKESHKVGLIYGTNIKTANTGFYVYDQNENTLSKYYDEEIKMYQDKSKQMKNYLMIAMGLFAFCAVIFIIISLVRSKKLKKRGINY